MTALRIGMLTVLGTVIVWYATITVYFTWTDILRPLWQRWRAR